jgi:hypothetical protein
MTKKRRISGITIKNTTFNGGSATPPSFEQLEVLKELAKGCSMTAQALHEIATRLASTPPAPSLLITGNKIT